MIISIIGPESSGKTTLGEELSSTREFLLIEEYSRRYLNNLEREYEIPDLREIAEGQLAELSKAIDQKNTNIIWDTDVITVKIWSMVKYGTYDKDLDEMIRKQPVDLYFLCRPDVPWAFDPLREVPDDSKRHEIFDLFQNELENFGFNYEVIEGNKAERIKKAQQLIRKLRY